MVERFPEHMLAPPPALCRENLAPGLDNLCSLPRAPFPSLPGAPGVACVQHLGKCRSRCQWTPAFQVHGHPVLKKRETQSCGPGVVEYYSAIKRDAVPTRAKLQVTLENLMLRETGQTQKDTDCVAPCIGRDHSRETHRDGKQALGGGGGG